MIRAALVVLAAFAAASLLPSARASDAPASPDARSRADVHFLAGYDHFRGGRADDARREWAACRELDEKHDFCEFGLSVLDAGAPRAAAAGPEEAVTAAPPHPEANQAYLEGVVYYQKGDYEKAREAWHKAKALAPAGSDVAKDATAGLEKLAVLYGTAPQTGDAAPKSLKTGAEKKDEHLALQTYFSGLIHYQKGDLEKARVEWKRALSLAPRDSSVEADAKAALAKLDKDEASTRRDGKK
ncbi:MAG: tetratricopeptide repeat protein [Elusimicrobia bacterium]|nr:tetratricopeptide repeat protein [Elusimicrobiota bacterium]